MAKGEAVFEQNDDGTFDMKVDGRTLRYDLDDDEIVPTLRNLRYPGNSYVLVDATGYRTRRKIR